MEPPMDNAPSDTQEYENWARDEHIKALTAERDRYRELLLRVRRVTSSRTVRVMIDLDLQEGG